MPDAADLYRREMEQHMTAKIITNFVYPPIPHRCFDWTAWRDGDEECGPTGFGATEGDAVQDLMDQIEDMQP